MWWFSSVFHNKVYQCISEGRMTEGHSFGTCQVHGDVCGCVLYALGVFLGTYAEGAHCM